jgi:hypothetical protein
VAESSEGAPDGEGTIVVAVGTAGAHVLFGAWGYFTHRYEAYAVAVCASAAMILWQATLAGWLTRARWWQVMIACLAVGYLGLIYLRTVEHTPEAARGIYEQQYQMRRFVVDFYRRPVAVNDIGWVSYRNPNYVLDIVGLGSEEVREARMSQAPEGWLDRLLEKHQIGLVIKYEHVGLPGVGWRRLAILHSTHIGIVNLERDVAFYATSASAAPAIKAALASFAPTLGSAGVLWIDPAS